MKKIAVKSLEAGMVFTQPVYIEGNNLLVPAGVEVRKKDIDRLKSWGVELVQTDGDLVPKSTAKAAAGTAAASAQPAAPAHTGSAMSGGMSGTSNNAPAAAKGAGGSAAAAAPAKKVPNALTLSEVQENTVSYRTYLDIIEKLDLVLTSIGEGVSVEARSIDNIAARLLQSVRDERDSFIGYILGGEVSGHEMAKSSVNTAILSALIGQELHLPNHKIMQLIIGALIHDVGMLRLPKEILDKRGGLSDAELQRIQAHPLYTHKIVSKELLYPEDVGLIALQHHERWDGEGYPRRISGSAIDMGARIVSVADAFEAMVSQKSYRSSMVGYQAMKNLLSDNSRRFDPDVLKAFIQTMGIYPIGSIVLLNSGAIGRVLEVHSDAPLRPKIRVLVDEFSKVFKQDEGDLIDLLQEKSMFIAKALDPKELAKKSK